MENYIYVNELEKTYNSKGTTKVKALKGVSFSLPDKGLIFIIGKSGCGKSTLLHILGGIDKPTGGEIFISNEKLDFDSESTLDRHRNENVGFVFQDHNLIDNFSNEDNIKMSLITQNKNASSEEIDDILKLVGLSNCKAKTPTQISGGQRQRVAIARALVKKTEHNSCRRADWKLRQFEQQTHI